MCLAEVGHVSHKVHYNNLTVIFCYKLLKNIDKYINNGVLLLIRITVIKGGRV